MKKSVKFFAALLTLSMFVGAPALAAGTAKAKTSGYGIPGKGCGPANPEFGSYSQCITYNRSIGNTDASEYCHRQCPK